MSQSGQNVDELLREIRKLGRNEEVITAKRDDLQRQLDRKEADIRDLEDDLRKAQDNERSAKAESRQLVESLGAVRQGDMGKMDIENLKKLELTNREQRQKIDDLQNENSALNELAKESEEELKDAREQMSSVTDEMASLKESFTQAEQELIALRGERSYLKDKVDDLEGDATADNENIVSAVTNRYKYNLYIYVFHYVN